MKRRTSFAVAVSAPAFASALLASDAAPAQPIPAAPSAEKAAAGDLWKRIQPGMTPAEVTALLPPPLIIANGHGYATWTYEQGGYVLFYADRVVALALPAPPCRKPAGGQKVAAESAEERRPPA